VSLYVRYIIILVLLSTSTIGVIAQHNPNKKSLKYLRKGIGFYNKHKYIKSLKYFDKSILADTSFVKPHLYKASLFYELKQYEKSRKEYTNILKNHPNYNSNIYYSLGVLSEKQNKLKDAFSYYKLFLDKSNKKGKRVSIAKMKIRNLPFIIKAKNNPIAFDPIPMNSAINSNLSEYLPTLSGDNKEIIFTRRIHGQEDFYRSKFENGNWQKAEPIIELNTNSNEGVHTLTSDGKTLIFTLCDKRKTFGSCDLFLSRKKNNLWSEPINLGKTINSPYWDSQPSISSDGKTLFFSSNRPGGFGGKDIWVSYWKDNNKWTKPIPLDSTINTKNDEQTPFIHADNTTLYFTSNGHPGMGGTDLYYSNKENGKWTHATNLGYPINTKYDEGALFVSLDGKYGYFSVDRKTKDNKNIDIYYFELPEIIKPKPVTYVKGIVLDSKNENALNAKITLFDNNTGQEIQSLYTNEDTFFIALPSGIDYNMSVKKQGYAFYSNRFVLSDSNTVFDPLKIVIKMIPFDNKNNITSYKPIVLKNIFFESNSSKLNTDKSKIELDNLYKLLSSNPRIKIEIIGHTDNVGDDDFNLKLSKQRAESIEKYLLNHKIADDRIITIGYGETQPIVPNTNSENRRKNRRVEFKIVY